MKSYTRLLPVAALLALPAAVRAQNELSNFTATGRGGVINTFATDYQSIGINPANLGRTGGALVAFSIGEVGLGAASRSLSKTLFRKIISDSGQAIDAAGKKELLEGMAGDNALNVNFDATSLAVSVRLPNGLGGVAISNRQRLGAHLALNRNAADYIVNGKNAASVQPYYPSTIGSTGTLPPPPLSEF